MQCVDFLFLSNLMNQEINVFLGSDCFDKLRGILKTQVQKMVNFEDKKMLPFLFLKDKNFNHKKSKKKMLHV